MPEYNAAFAYRGNKSTTANANLARSTSLWYDCPYDQIKSGEVEGTFIEFDGANFKLSTNVNASVAYWAGGFNLYGSDGAVLAALDAVGGGVTFSSDGDNEGVAFQQAVAPFQILRAGSAFWLEAVLQTSTIADTKHGFFLGLVEPVTLSATVPIAAAGTLTDNNFVGFHRLEGDGDKLDTVYKANGVTQVTVQADAVTLVAATDIKVGMKFVVERDPYIQGPDSTAKFLLTPFQNGVALTTKQIPSAAGTDFPNDVRMALTFALLNATGTTPGSTTIKKIWAAQLT